MLDRRLVIIGGKGGVGRTTISAALALTLARQGRRVLLAHVRTKQLVHRMLGCDQLTEEIREVVPRLWAVNMNPEAALRERGLMVLRFKAVYRAVMENRLVKYFLKAIPSLDEYSMLGKAWYHTTEVLPDGRPKYDTVIFDGPATGHLVTMLRIPQVIVETVPEGPLTADAYRARDLLQDPRRTAMWLVALAEEMATSEAIELYHTARTVLQINPQQVVANGLYPDVLEQEPQLRQALDQVVQGGGADDPATGPLVRTARTFDKRRRIHRANLDRLQRELPLPLMQIPYIFRPELDQAALEQIAARMERALNTQT